MMGSDLLRLFETILFKDIKDTDEYGIHIKKYERGELISPDEITDVGIVLNGNIKIYKNDLSGGISIIEHIDPGELIGETSVMLSDTSENITYICSKKTDVAYFDWKSVFKNPQLAERFAVMLAENRKKLRERAMVLSGRSIREKLKCYFEIIMAKKGKKSFTLPGTMGSIANFLSVDRSAMSREIKKMKEEELIRIEKHTVTILWEIDS